MKTIIVKEYGRIRDGGTTEYRDSNGNQYFVDNRIASKTKGKVYDRYPSEKGANILDVTLIANG